MFGLELKYMPEPDEVERIMREKLLELDDEQICSKLEDLLSAMNERDRIISETLEGLLQEVDDLILLADELEDEDSSGG